MNIFSWLAKKYAEVTWVRHAVIFAGAFLILEYGVMASDFARSHLHSEALQTLIGAALAWGLRWSQTKIELLIARLK